MTTGEKIAYAIEKEMCRNNLEELLEYWEINYEDYAKFIQAGIHGIDEVAERQIQLVQNVMEMG